MAKPQTLRLSVRDFALPSPRVGSIEPHSGFGHTPEEGAALHVKLQAERSNEFSHYLPEFLVRREFAVDRFRFHVSGRIDGLFKAHHGNPALIEEIKTSFQLGDLKSKLERGPSSHPYCLQLRTYGYFYWLETNEIPELRFFLVSPREDQREFLSLDLDIPSYEEWLARRLEELSAEAKRSLARAKRRRRLVGHFLFPYPEMRPGQESLIQKVEETMKSGKPLFIQAPTGLGKTAAVLYPVLKDALSRGQNAIYLTPKNSQHEAAEAAVGLFREKGTNLRSLTLTAKAKICLKPEPFCHPDYCEYARDHYTKMAERNVSVTLTKKKSWDESNIRAVAKKHEVCPFELQFEAAREADAVICDYNYVFSPRSSAARISRGDLGEKGRPNLVVDEAHNLASRGMSYYSPSLSTFSLSQLRESSVSGATLSALDSLIASVSQAAQLEEPLSPAQLASVLFDEQMKIERAIAQSLSSGLPLPSDPLLRAHSELREFTSVLELMLEADSPQFFLHAEAGPYPRLKIACCDASAFLGARFDSFESVVAFSATLKPFDYYAKLSGLDMEKIESVEFSSPFPARNRKILIIPQISTKYSQRERNYSKIAEVVARVASLKRGNYFAFFPSFEFLERTARCIVLPEGFRLFRQEREMRLSRMREILEELRSGDTPTIVLAVQGGIFSEGVDYPGKAVIGAFVVGPPLPLFDQEREKMREYYESRYGEGFAYAYAYPAMAKAIQSAGRVIRSERDQGIIVLMDNRFLEPQFVGSMPEGWFDHSAEELVSSSVLSEIASFWKGLDPSR